jgi:hypothetical protein
MDSNAAFGFSLLTLAVSALFAASVVAGHAKDSPWVEYAYHQPSGEPQQCAVGHSLVADGNYNNGFTRATTRSATLDPVFANPCGYPAVKEPGKMKVRWKYFHKNDSHGWRLCADIDAQFNQQDTAEMTRYRDWEHKPCGHGFYKTEGRHGVTMGGDMRDGTTESPDHHFG